jgi:hypothetical protein
VKRSMVIGTIVIASGLGLAAPLQAARRSESASPAIGAAQSPAESAGEACMSDVRAFTTAMSKQGYWSGGSDYSYGYPMAGYGFGMMTGGTTTARPGYEIRTLIASANILAGAGRQKICEHVLDSAKKLYTTYAADLRNRGLSWEDQSGWRRREIAEAQPVTARDRPLRSDQLLDADIISPVNETLGSLHDLVTEPQTGKIDYAIISRGGLFGIDASYTPVPWSAFKATPNGTLLVLDTTRAVLAAAPEGNDTQFTRPGQYAVQSAKVDAYWTTHLTLAAAQ